MNHISANRLSSQPAVYIPKSDHFAMIAAYARTFQRPWLA